MELLYSHPQIQHLHLAAASMTEKGYVPQAFPTGRGGMLIFHQKNYNYYQELVEAASSSAQTCDQPHHGYKITIIKRDEQGTWVVSRATWLMLGACLTHVLIHLYIRAENRTFS
jgi:hypothetical protein